MIDSYLQGARQRFTEFGGFVAAEPASLPEAMAAWADSLLVRQEPGLTTLVALLPLSPEGILKAVRDELAEMAGQLAREQKTQVLGLLLIITAERLTRDRYSRWQELIINRSQTRIVPWVADLTRGVVFAHDGPPFGVDPDLVTLAEPEPDLPAECSQTPQPRRAPAPAYPFPYMTVGLVALLVAIWAAMTAVGGKLNATEDVTVLHAWGGLTRPDLWQTGQYWRIFTANFLHAGAVHLVMNSLGLWAVGRLVEWWMGAWRMLLIFLLAGVAGFTLSAAAGPPYAISAGASGAILGLLGALFWYRLSSPLRDRIPWSPLLWVAGATAISSAALYFMMDNWNHTGGFVGGFVAAAAIGVPTVPGNGAPRFRLHGAVHALLALALVAASVALVGGLVDLPGPGRNLARSLGALEAGRYADAEAGLRKAVQRQSDDAGLRLMLSQALLLQGKCREARAEWAEARQAEPDSEGVAVVEQMLRQCGH